MLLKRFAALVTKYWDRYNNDIFFRTEVNIISLLVGFTLIIFILVWMSFNVHYHAFALISMVIAIGIFGYIVAQITLWPARNSLTSQKQFIGNVAHELRTPLSIIKTNAEVALLDPSVPKEIRETLEDTIEELDRTSDIINNLLSLSNLTRPGRIPFTPVDLSELAENVAQKYEGLARRADLRVTVRRSPRARVWGNATALEQILGNLLKNAITYTPSGGQVSVTVAPYSHRMIELSVQDSGIGISRSDLFRIFEPFYRADQSRARFELKGRRSHSGSGLGLAIVSELLKLHQGKIAIKSAVGRGTNVTILIPAASKDNSAHTETNGLDQITVDFSHTTREPKKPSVTFPSS